MQNKRCACCAEEKSIELFGRDKARKDGLNPYCKECVAGKSRDYTQKNLEKVRVSKIAYDKRNKEKIKHWRQKNSEKLKAYWVEYGKKYRQTFKVETMEKTRRQQAAKRQRLPSWFDEFDAMAMREAYELAKLRNAATGVKWDVDHMIPMQGRKASGLHCAMNLQVIPASMNRSKINKMIYTEPGQWIMFA